MVDWNPNTMYSNIHLNQDVNMENDQSKHTHSSVSQRDDHSLEQRSGPLDQTTNHAEAKREVVGGIYPSDFGGYLLHPETIQTSTIQNRPEDMSVYYQKKQQPLSTHTKVPATIKEETNVPPPNYTPTPQSTHDSDIMFFGDSNTTEPRAKSRSTLDQDGLFRGSISTLPSSSDKRRSYSISGSRPSKDDTFHTTEPRATSRSMLDQDGLRRGSISTLPSASDRRRSSRKVIRHENAYKPSTAVPPFVAPAPKLDQGRPISTSNKSLTSKEQQQKQQQQQQQQQSQLDAIETAPIHKQETEPTTELSHESSLTERAYAVAAGVAAGVAGAATSLFSPTDKDDGGYDVNGPRFVVRDEYGPYKDATTCGYEPALHGQEPCFKSNEERKSEVKPDDKHPFCSHVQEPVLCGERPTTSTANLEKNEAINQSNNPPFIVPDTTTSSHANVVESSQDQSNTAVTPKEDAKNLIFTNFKGIPLSEKEDDDNNQKQEEGGGFLNKVTSAGTAAAVGVAAVASGAAATLFGDSSKQKETSPNKSLQQDKQETDLKESPTAAVALTQAAALKNQVIPTTVESKDTNHSDVEHKKEIALGVGSTTTTAAAAAAAATLASKDASIPSDKSINSAAAIQHGPVEQTSDSSANKHDDTMRRNSSSLKSKASAGSAALVSAFRRLSRDSGSSSSNIDKSSIVKQNDGRRLSDAEQFKQHVQPQQAYVRAPGVTPGPTEGESQFVRVDEGAQVQPNQAYVRAPGVTPGPTEGESQFVRVDEGAQVQPNQAYVRTPGITPGPSEGESQFVRVDEGQPITEIPSRSSYVSGHIEHRRGSIQKVIGTILNKQSLKDKGEITKMSGKEKIEAYKAAKEAPSN